MFSLSIISPDQVLYEGEIKALASNNDSGPFSMLPGHANFITLIKDKITVYPLKGKPETFNINRGVLAYRQNKVEAFVGFKALPTLVPLQKPPPK